MKKDKSIKPGKRPNVMLAHAAYVNKQHEKALKPVGMSTSMPPTGSKTDSGQISTSIGVVTSVLPELPEAAMPGILGEVVRAVCMKSEVHPAYVLADVLSRIATQVSEPYIKYSSVQHHCRMNVVLVGNSSKSWKATSTNAVDRIFNGMPDKAQHLDGLLLTGESLIDAVRDETSLSGNKHRKQAVISPGITDKRLLFNDMEFRSALAYAKRPGSTLAATVSGLFDNGCAEQFVKSNKISATGAHVNILAHTSCVDFSALRNDVQQSNGFASLFLWLLVDRLKRVPRPKAMTDEDVEFFQKTIASRIQAAKCLTSVKMSKPAWKLWDDLYPGLTKDVPDIAGSVVSRSEIHTIRLALLYALVAGRKQIETKNLNAAHALVQYARESAFIVFKGSQGDNFKEKILCALHAAPKHEMSRTEISTNVFNKNVESVDIKAALREMAELKLITVIKDTSKTGAPKTIFRLVSVQSHKTDFIE